jgi:probable HAF family extracellular repeat protein
MKANKMTCATLVVLLAVLAVPAQLAAQGKQSRHHKQHHYQLVDLGSTFGGPGSYFNEGSNNSLLQFTSVLNRGGTVAGFADTSVPDPFPNLCFWDCVVAHAFQAGSDGGLTDLGALPGGGSSAPLWISANGLIAGVSENGETDPLYAGLPEFRAVLWQHGKITDLGTLPEGGYESEANAVNSAGQVVGAALNTIPDTNSMQAGTFWLWGGSGGINPPYQYQTRAFLWDRKNGMQDLGTLPGGTDAQALLINAPGQVVGWSYTSSTPSTACGFALTTGSFIWEKKHGMKDIGGFGGTCTAAADLNNQGQVVGIASGSGDAFSRPFLWDGSIHDLGGSLGGDASGATAINDDGEAVGYAFFPGNTVFHATLWRHVGKMTDLGTLGTDPCSYSTSINADEQVVGGSLPDCNNPDSTRAVLWEDGKIFDLNTLIPLSSTLYLRYTYTINTRGEIAGEGVDGGGNGHAFLLVPCDENHSGVGGCDYSLVDGAAVARENPGSVVQRPTPSAPNTAVPNEPARRVLRPFHRGGLRFNLGHTAPQDWSSAIEDNLGSVQANRRRPYGFCDASNGVLTGYCTKPGSNPHHDACHVTYSPTYCPPGQRAKKPEWTQCNDYGTPFEEDLLTTCQ